MFAKSPRIADADSASDARTVNNVMRHEYRFAQHLLAHLRFGQDLIDKKRRALHHPPCRRISES
jgi:hypothetical protein